MRDNIDSDQLLNSVCQNQCIHISYLPSPPLFPFLVPHCPSLDSARPPLTQCFPLHVLFNMLISEGLLDNEDLCNSGTEMIHQCQKMINCLIDLFSECMSVLFVLNCLLVCFVCICICSFCLVHVYVFALVCVRACVCFSFPRCQHH